MDLFELLNRIVEKKDLNKEDDKEKERWSRRNLIGHGLIGCLGF